MKHVVVIKFIFITMAVFANITSHAQNYEGVEKLSLAELETELTDAQSLLTLRSIKDIIDYKHGCQTHSSQAKRTRQALLDLHAEYKTKQADGNYTRKDTGYRLMFKDRMLRYEKCFNDKLTNIASLPSKDGVSNYATYRVTVKNLAEHLSKRGDLNPYVVLLKDLMQFEKENLPAAKFTLPKPLMSEVNPKISKQQSAPTNMPIALTIGDAVAVSRQFLRAQEKYDVEGMFGQLSPPLQKELLATRTKKDIQKFAGIPKKYLYSKINCALCFSDQMLGDVCQVKIHNNKRWQKSLEMSQSVLYTLKLTQTNQGYVPKITNISETAKAHKKFKKRNPVCEGL